MKGFLVAIGLIGALIGIFIIARPDSSPDLSGAGAEVSASSTETVITPAAGNGPVALSSDDVEKEFALQVADFEVETTRGTKVKLSDLAKDRPTMVGFWASWCPNCRRNLPVQNDLFSKYSDRVHIVEVNLNETRDKVDNYVDGKGFDFFVAYDEQGLVSRAWGVGYTNTHILIGNDGSLIDIHTGDVDDSIFQRLLGSS
ncbi:MAG: redoxin domain-containing protein [Patescibacteria group bacterium]